ncbi:uncharacterized protein [Pleurodeles waltl]|uniref:uncharacterized protein n=1 Tax=Pleurodeles waltl TaxID=8319 RepID=UPI003709C1D8
MLHIRSWLEPAVKPQTRAESVCQGAMKRYNPIARKAVSSGALNTIGRYYRTLAPRTMDENAQQGVPDTRDTDVTGFQEELCHRLEKLDLKDVSPLISPIKGAGSDSDVSKDGLSGASNVVDIEVEECVPPPNSPIYEDMGFQDDPEAEAFILQPSGVSSGAVSAPMDLCDSQDFRGASECEANAENITEEREPLEGSAPKVNTVNFFCLCCSRQSESITSQNKEPRKKCVCTYTSHDLEKEAPGVPCDTIWPVKGFAAAVVNACVKRDYYDLCYGHKINDPQQEAHECLYDAYTARTIRHVCNRIDTYRVYKLLRVVYGLSAVKKSVHCDMMKVLAAAVLEIRYAAEPCSKLDRMHGMCPPFDKRMVERVIERRMCDIYYKNRRMLSLAPRKLF